MLTRSLAGILRRNLFISNNNGIQQAEQACEIHSAQIIPVGAVTAVPVQSALQRSRVLYNTSPQKADIRGEERIDVFSAVFIVQSIVHHCIDAIVQIHAAWNLSPLEQIILPAIQIERPQSPASEQSL